MSLIVWTYFIESQLKKYVDNAILSLQESGQLEILKKKWWETDKCPVSNYFSGLATLY